ncbi:hypothetical protein T265_12044 [Opisthorchis viverrini]|uniref:Uncharacterized protein n=1 Tax=Opisthorchis viverrini TaxID=6198 RepID=A0A074Z729_OPIVI|nr:hypothetical protein T265_12044 [Opisthorchis viverrini]KER19030.1 hypothetical protein T265_12044 [Opisthorchis viverrini]
MTEKSSSVCLSMIRVGLTPHYYCVARSIDLDGRIEESWIKVEHAKSSWRSVSVMPPEKSTRAEILSGCPSLELGSRDPEVRFEPRAFRSSLRVKKWMRGNLMLVCRKHYKVPTPPTTQSNNMERN